MSYKLVRIAGRMGVKRNKQNLGKFVRIHGHKHFDGRTGKIVGFRGDDIRDGVVWPHVQVFVYSVGSVWPFQGCDLEIIDESELGDVKR